MGENDRSAATYPYCGNMNAQGRIILGRMHRSSARMSPSRVIFPVIPKMHRRMFGSRQTVRAVLTRISISATIQQDSALVTRKNLVSTENRTCNRAVLLQ